MFSLKTADKAEACRLADAQTRRLDALWKAHREGNKTAVDPLVALATLEVAGMSPGDAVRYPDHPAISDFVDRLIGQHEPTLAPDAADGRTNRNIHVGRSNTSTAVAKGCPTTNLLTVQMTKLMLSRGSHSLIASASLLVLIGDDRKSMRAR